MKKLSKEKFLQEFASKLIQVGLSAEVALEIAQHIDPDGYVTSRPPRGGFGLISRVGYWVIRDDDLKLVASFVTGVTAAVAASFFDGSVSTSAIVGIVSGCINVVRAARRKGAQIPPLGFKLLVALRTREAGLTVQEATDVLNAIVDDDTPDLHTSDVAELLNELAATRVADGSVVAFVAKDAQERWSASGV